MDCDFFGGGDSRQAPDNSVYNAATAEAVRNNKEIADRDYAYRVAKDTENAPRIQAAYEQAMRIAKGQEEDANTSRERGLTQWNQYQDKFVPLENKMVAEANAYGGDEDQALQAGREVSDVNQQFGLSRAMNNRAMSSMGVNPNSGRFASMGNQSGYARAAAAAGGANHARTTARDKGIGLRAGAAGFGRNQVNTAGQMTGIATASGNSATGNANAGVNNGLGWANFAAGGSATGIAANNSAIQANLGMGELQLNGHMAAQQAATANRGQTLGLMGAGLGAGASYMRFSDRRLKSDLVMVGKDEKTRLNLYEFNYTNGDPNRYRGVMADEVAKDFPHAVAYGHDGFARVNYATLGLQMERV